MAHKVLVNGTVYNIKGGRTLVGGTGYSIKKGRTLVDGTGYDISFAVGISSITLNYASSVNVGSTISPTVSISPSNYDALKSKVFSITSGSSYATINSSTGALTGVAAGTVTVKVTIVDALGKTFTATNTVSVKSTGYTIKISFVDGDGHSEYYVQVNGTKYTSDTSLTVYSSTTITISLFATENGHSSSCHIYSSGGSLLKIFSASYQDDYNSGATVYTYTATQSITVQMSSSK